MHRACGTGHGRGHVTEAVLGDAGCDILGDGKFLGALERVDPLIDGELGAVGVVGIVVVAYIVVVGTVENNQRGSPGVGIGH